MYDYAMHLLIRRKLFFSHFLTVLLVSGSIGTYFYISAIDSLLTSLQLRLQNSAALISQVLDATDLDEIRGQSDVSRPLYRKYLNLLRTFRRTNPDIAFLYVMRRVGDRIYFVVDSDETTKQAFPGQEYLSVMPALQEGFFKSSVDNKIYTDEWGSFMSGYAPLKNGEGRYLVGMDMRAAEVQNKLRNLRMSGILSLLCSIILTLLFSRLLSFHFISPIQLLISRCSAIASGQLEERLETRTGDELDNLIDAFNGMSADLGKVREKNRQVEDVLKQAKNDLELRVTERTQDLRNLNDQLSHEIIERKRVEEQIQKLNDELEQRVLNRTAELEVANKELESFAYSVAHDLRSPLRSIDGFSQSVLESTGDKLSTEAIEDLNRVRRAAQKMSALIDALLAMSRITRRKMTRERVDLGGIVLKIEKEIRARDPKRRVELFVGDVGEAAGDPQLLRIVLQDLLGNAWKFTRNTEEARIEFGVTEKDGFRAYYVRDNGVGFDMAYSDKLFGAFQRLHSETEFEGRGIGLAMVQRIIQRHGGRVWAEGLVGKGSTFYFTL